MILSPQKRIRTIALASAGILCITLVAWNREPVYQYQDTINYRDTVPAPARSKSVRNSDKQRDFDEELRKLDEASEKLGSKSHEDWNKLSADLNLELSKINLDELHLSAETAINNIDLKKINVDLKNALASVDFDDIKIKLDKSLADLNINIDVKSDELRKALAEAKIEARQGIEEAQKISSDEVRKALKEAAEEVRKTEITTRKEIRDALKEANKEVQRNLSDIKIDQNIIAESMQSAKKGIEKAKVEFKGYQEMIYDMEEKGLLDTDDDYKVKYAEGKLTINGQKQSSEVTEKYSRYFNKETTVIKKSGGKLSINKTDQQD